MLVTIIFSNTFSIISFEHHLFVHCSKIKMSCMMGMMLEGIETVYG